MWSEKFPSNFFSCSSLFLLFGMYRTPEIFYVYTKKYVHAVFYSLLFLHK